MNRPAMPSAVDEDQAMGDLRREVREFISQETAAGRFVGQVDSWLTGWDEDFSRSLAERGWLGMTIPVHYGGRGQSFLERFVVTEELLAAGAPPRRPLDRGPADRAVAAQVRHRVSENEATSRNCLRRNLFRHRHE
jgi:alkylation response protein AidB-like acyl-CoA dehydrogenase